MYCFIVIFFVNVQIDNVENAEEGPGARGQEGDGRGRDQMMILMMVIRSDDDNDTIVQ